MSDSTNPTAYRGPDLPTPLGEQLRLALGLDERPTTFGDWVDALAFLAERDGVDVDLDTLCTTDESPHRATFDGRTQHYRCVQDPIIVPFLSDEVDVVTVETESPVSGEPIELRVTETTIAATPADVVLSFGVAADVESPSAAASSPVLAYSRFCPYGHAFPSREEYETWDAEVDAVTMTATLEEAHELARAIGSVA